MSGLLGTVFRPLRRWIIPGFIVLIVLFATLSLTRDEWRIPLTDIQRGQQDTPLGLTLGLDLQGGVHLVYETVDPNPTPEQLQGVVQIIRTRVDQFGVAEPLIQTLGANRIVVQLPGVQDVQAAKDLIGAPAVLDFRELVTIPIEPGEDTGIEIELEPTGDTETEATPETQPTIGDGAESTPDSTSNAADATTGPSDGTTSAPKVANVSPSLLGQATPEPDATDTPTIIDAEATAETTDTGEQTEAVEETPTPEPEPEFRLEWQIASAEVDGEEVELTGDRLEPGSAQVGFNPTTGAPEVYFQMDSQGREAFRIVSGRMVGELLGIFLDGEAILTPPHTVRDSHKPAHHRP